MQAAAADQRKLPWAPRPLVWLLLVFSLLTCPVTVSAVDPPSQTGHSLSAAPIDADFTAVLASKTQGKSLLAAHLPSGPPPRLALPRPENRIETPTAAATVPLPLCAAVLPPSLPRPPPAP